MSPGFTVIEMAIGVVTAAVIAMTTAQLFKAGILTFNYTMRQNYILSGTRKTLAGDGKRQGILWASHVAPSVQSLSAGSLVLRSTDSLTTTFSLSNQNLYQIKSGDSALLAEGISSLALSYYNMDADGRIMVSTQASAASFVSALVTMAGKTSSQRTYTAFSGARLRNHE